MIDPRDSEQRLPQMIAYFAWNGGKTVFASQSRADTHRDKGEKIYCEKKKEQITSPVANDMDALDLQTVLHAKSNLIMLSVK